MRRNSWHVKLYMKWNDLSVYPPTLYEYIIGWLEIILIILFLGAIVGFMIGIYITSLIKMFTGKGDIFWFATALFPTLVIIFTLGKILINTEWCQNIKNKPIKWK